MLKVDFDVPIDVERLEKALTALRIAHIHIPLVHVRVKESRIVFIVYAIRDDDSVYAKVLDEDDESKSDACKPVYFFFHKRRTIDYPRLIKAIKAKVQGVMRKQRKVDEASI